MSVKSGWSVMALLAGLVAGISAPAAAVSTESEVAVLAGGYHQDYYFTHANSAYIVYNDVPKVKALERRFPKLWRAKPSRMLARS